MTAKTIETHNFTLRALCPGDASDLAELISDWEVIRWLSGPPYPYGVSDAEAFIESTQDLPLYWAIVTDRLIGAVSGLERLGYWLGRPYWGHGIISSAAEIAVTACFEETDADRIESGYLMGNLASRRVQEKLGFRDVGRRMMYSNSNRRSIEHIDTVLTRTDWERRAA